MAEPEGLHEIVVRNAEAVVAGNFAQIMADITPEALAQMMQMAPTDGSFSLANMPGITGYELAFMGEEGDACLYHVTFESEPGRATLGVTWKSLMGQWKITAVSVVGVEPKAPGQ